MARPRTAGPEPAPGSTPHAGDAAVVMGLSAAILALDGETPQVLTVRQTPDAAGAAHALPFGPFEPLAHRTLEIGLRSWVSAQTGLDLGYVEQLYTFGDRGRHQTRPGEGPRVVSIGYLALARRAGEPAAEDAGWRSWYAFFPWEDWRAGRPGLIDTAIRPLLERFAAGTEDRALRSRRSERARLCFGLDGIAWDDEKTLERYELLYEAGLVAEAARDGRSGAADPAPSGLGLAMAFDHRRILATAMGRLRAKLKYRPVIFEMMAAEFTLTELQRAAEAIAGHRVHTQNFRRLVETAGLVEPTGRQTAHGRGRPAALFRFRREVLRERPAPGVRIAATASRPR